MNVKTLIRIPAMLAIAALLASPLAASGDHDKEGASEQAGSGSEMKMDQGKGGGKWNKKRADKMAKKLGLSDEQKTKMKALHKKFRKDNKGLRKEMKTAHESMRKAMQDSKVSEESLRAKHEAIIKMVTKKCRLRFEKKLAMRALLNPEQREKFMKMHKGKKGKHSAGSTHEGMMGGDSSYDE